MRGCNCCQQFHFFFHPFFFADCNCIHASSTHLDAIAVSKKKIADNNTAMGAEAQRCASAQKKKLKSKQSRKKQNTAMGAEAHATAARLKASYEA